ncbi:MAG: hypothetical protein PHZ00_01850 [Candidatus Peribacteraceae bacterium]|nr:hypothetical protein [Candidatus Peribacteraceae bacterium]
MQFISPLKRTTLTLVLVHVAMLAFVIVAMVKTLPTQALPI